MLRLIDKVMPGWSSPSAPRARHMAIELSQIDPYQNDGNDTDTLVADFLLQLNSKIGRTEPHSEEVKVEEAEVGPQAVELDNLDLERLQFLGNEHSDEEMAQPDVSATAKGFQLVQQDEADQLILRLPNTEHSMSAQKEIHPGEEEAAEKHVSILVEKYSQTDPVQPVAPVIVYIQMPKCDGVSVGTMTGESEDEEDPGEGSAGEKAPGEGSGDEEDPGEGLTGEAQLLLVVDDDGGAGEAQLLHDVNKERVARVAEAGFDPENLEFGPIDDLAEVISPPPEVHPGDPVPQQVEQRLLAAATNRRRQAPSAPTLPVPPRPPRPRHAPTDRRPVPVVRMNRAAQKRIERNGRK